MGFTNKKPVAPVDEAPVEKLNDDTILAIANTPVKTKIKHIVNIKPVETTGGTVKSNLNGGKVNKLLPNGTLILATQKDEYDNPIEFISEEEFELLVRKFNPRANYRDFLLGYQLRFTDKGLKLDVAVPDNMVKYKFCQVHSWIASSKSGANPAIHFFFIEDETAEAKISNLKMEVELDCFAALKKMSSVDRRDFLKLYGIVPDTFSDEIVLKRLRDFIAVDPEKFILRYDDIHKAIKILISSLILKGVLRRNGKSIFYEETCIGGNEELAVEYLNNGANDDLLTQLYRLNK